jgi:hypothetical protein
MRFARSGVAVATGFIVFSFVFAVIGPSMGAALTCIGAGLVSGYLGAKIAPSRPLIHGGATAGLVAASIIAQPVFDLGTRAIIAALAAAAVWSGAWIRAQANAARADITVEDVRRGPQGHGGEGRS